MEQYLKTFIISVLAIGLIACAGTQRAPNQSESGAAPGPSVLVSSYKMGVEDEVSINVWQNPELSVQTPIRPDGKIAMPLIGDVMAAGKDPKQLADDISLTPETFRRYWDDETSMLRRHVKKLGNKYQLTSGDYNALYKFYKTSERKKRKAERKRKKL